MHAEPIAYALLVFPELRDCFVISECHDYFQIIRINLSTLFPGILVNPPQSNKLYYKMNHLQHAFAYPPTRVEYTIPPQTYKALY